MIDLQAVNQAIFDTLQQVTSPGTRYILVLWEADKRASISTTEVDEIIVQRMLARSAQIVASSEPFEIRIDETMGHA